MRRSNHPYNGKQFILNKNTFEVHNLDRETQSCKIDEIKLEHVHSCNSYLEACVHSGVQMLPQCNGCAFCMPEEHTT